ncbi:MAG: glutamine synthetase family protein [Pirellulaceae bacterium]
MSLEKGMLDLDQLRELVGRDEIDTVLVVFTDLYGRFMGKRFDASFFLDQVASGGTHACNYLLTVDMEMEPVPGYQFANWEKGYGDFHVVPNLNTLRIASWLDRTALVLSDVECESAHGPVDVAPRSLLKQQVERATNLGLEVMGASELEYYIFRDSYRDAMQKNYGDLKTAGWYLEDYHTLQGGREEDLNGAARRHLAASGVPVESTKGEWGIGQHELNIRYCEVVEMADRHGVLKQCLKEVADRLGASVTFMAKYAADQAGSSCHVHMSLWREGVNAFAGDVKVGDLRVSDTFRHFVGGWLARLPELMVFIAPTVNSYKRFQSESWAPTRLAWSVDNRTAGIRVVGSGSSLRLECRVPGADCNPYLTYAALLSAGLDGIANETEPPAIFVGDVYQTEDAPSVPQSLREATDRFESSDFAKTTFGEDVVKHYAHFFRVEQEAFDRSVTDWERVRYFERI